MAPDSGEAESRPDSPFRFLDLPGDVRNRIYTFVVESSDSLRYINSRDGLVAYKACNLAQTCWQIASEMAILSCRRHTHRLAFLIDFSSDLPPETDTSQCICKQPLREADIVRFSPITAFVSLIGPAMKEYFLEFPITIAAIPQEEAVLISRQTGKLLCLLASILPEVQRYRLIGLESANKFETRILDAFITTDLKHLTRKSWSCEIEIPDKGADVDLYIRRTNGRVTREYHRLACSRNREKRVLQ